MKSDSYSRYLRSEMYKDFLNGSKKKVNQFVHYNRFENFNILISIVYFQTSVKGIRSIVSFSGKKETSTS